MYIYIYMNRVLYKLSSKMYAAYELYPPGGHVPIYICILYTTFAQLLLRIYRYIAYSILRKRMEKINIVSTYTLRGQRQRCTAGIEPGIYFIRNEAMLDPMMVKVFDHFR